MKSSAKDIPRIMRSDRLRLLFQTAAIKWIDPIFAKRHPGSALRAFIRCMGPLVRCLEPNDKWNLCVFITEWVKILDVPPVEPLPIPKRIFIFSCYRGQYTHDVILSLLLAWRGHKVTLGYLPKLQSPIKDPLVDHQSAAPYLRSVLGEISCLTKGRVSCVDLSPLSESSGDYDEAYLSSQLRTNIVMRLRQEHYDLNDPDVELARRHYEELGRLAQRIAFTYLSKNQGAIDLCLIANGESFEGGQFCHVAKKLGIPVNTHEKFAFSKTRVITHGDAVFHFSDLDRIWARRRELGFLNDPMREYVIGKAWDLLNQRRNSSGPAWGWQYQKGKLQRTAERLTRKLEIETGQFALICPNVPFDAGYDGWLQIFPSMQEWLVQTITCLLRYEHLRVVVRAHPAETRPGFGREPIASVLEEAGISSSRLIILSGDSDINTYDLMSLCKFAVVFASTTGVEIAMHGKPVLAGASVYYTRFGITVSASDHDEYFTRLAELVGEAECEDKTNADNAAILYFILHYLLQWPFPYDKPTQITALPPKKLVSNPMIKAYIPTLDVLSLDTTEYEAKLPTLIDLKDLKKIAVRWGWSQPESQECVKMPSNNDCTATIH